MINTVTSGARSGSMGTLLDSWMLVVLLNFIGPNTGGAASQMRRPDPAKFQELLLKVFGDIARLDPKMRRNVLAGKAGERHYVDQNGDGNPEGSNPKL